MATITPKGSAAGVMEPRGHELSWARSQREARRALGQGSRGPHPPPPHARGLPTRALMRIVHLHVPAGLLASPPGFLIPCGGHALAWRVAPGPRVGAWWPCGLGLAMLTESSEAPGLLGGHVTSCRWSH